MSKCERRIILNRNRNNFKQTTDFGCSSSCNLYSVDTVNANPLAMAYVPWQYWETPLEPCEALEVGTIFSELNKPFLGRKC